MLNILLNNPSSISFTEIIIWIFSTVAVIFITMPIHEYAHARVAVALGDNTPRYQGRLSLNPFYHIDWLGALSILLLGVGWANPVSVNMYNFKNRKLGMAAVAAAGPLANILLALASLVLYNALNAAFNATYFVLLAFLAQIFYFIAYINVSLAIFNLLPLPPFDGSRILGIILPDKIYYTLMKYEQYLLYGVFALILLGVFDTPLFYGRYYTLGFLSMIARYPFSLLGLI